MTRRPVTLITMVITAHFNCLYSTFRSTRVGDESLNEENVNKQSNDKTIQAKENIGALKASRLPRNK